MKLPYRVTVYPLSEADGGGWFAEIPELPGCASDGETPERALANLQDAKREWFLAALETGRPIPKPTPLNQEYSGRILVRAPKALHRRLVYLAKAQGVSLNQMVVYLLTRGVEMEQQAFTTERSARVEWQRFEPVESRSESPSDALQKLLQLKELAGV